MTIPLGISVQDSTILFKKQKYSDFENEIVTCMYPSVSMSDGIVSVNTAQAHKDTMKVLLRSFFPSIYTDTSFDKKGLGEAIKKAYDNAIELAYSSMRSHPLFPKLMEHQQYGAMYCITRKHNLLSFQQGLGKTFTSIFISEYLKLKTLVICPAISKYSVWFEELQHWGVPVENISVIDTKKSITALGEEKYVVINYDIIDKYLPLLIEKGIQHIVPDECHYLKNTESKRFKHVHALAIATNAKITLLSGTPIKNRVNDMFAYLLLCGHPLGTNKKAFLKRFTVTENTRFGKHVTGGQNLDQLSTLVSSFVIRKRQEDCINLPPQVYMRYMFEMGEYFEEYKKALRDFARLMQENTENVEVGLHRLLILTTKSKLKSIIELAQSIIDNDEQIAIFCNYREPLYLLKNHFGDMSEVIDGSVHPHKRGEIINLFKNDKSKKALLCNTQAAGLSINLQFMNNAIIANYPLTYADFEQIVFRFKRPGQQYQTNIFETIAKGSIDERIHDLMHDKRKEAERVIDMKESAIQKTDFNKSILQDLIQTILKDAA